MTPMAGTPAPGAAAGDPGLAPGADGRPDRVAALLAPLPGAPRCETVVVQTTGDALTDVPVGRARWSGRLRQGGADSPSLDGRADARGALGQGPALDDAARTRAGMLSPSAPIPATRWSGRTLEELPAGATVATGSVRRRAQLAWLRPDLTFCDLRGNMATRLERARESGPEWWPWRPSSGWASRRTWRRSSIRGRLLPQVGQGALAVECRDDDDEVLELLAAVDDPVAHSAVVAERAFLAALGGGCTLPLGGLAVPVGLRRALLLDAFLASRDGRVLLRQSLTGPTSQPAQLGTELARVLLDDCGGRSLDDWSEADVTPAFP